MIPFNHKIFWKEAQHMKKLVSKLVERHGSSLCTLVTVVAPVAVNNCRSRLYQPKEPEGLEDFVLAHKKKM